jgi:hypothetical protein
MCPACVASAAWVALGVGSTGGLTALTAKILHLKKGAEPISSKITSEEKTKER